MLAKHIPILLHLCQTMIASEKTFDSGNLSRQRLQTLPPGPPTPIKDIYVLDCRLTFASMTNPPRNFIRSISLPETTCVPPNLKICACLELNVERKEGREQGADVLVF